MDNWVNEWTTRQEKVNHHASELNTSMNEIKSKITLDFNIID